MGKETAIKVSKIFKQFLVEKKQEGEDYEATIVRLISSGKPVNQEQLTSKPEPVNQLTDSINTNQFKLIEETPISKVYENGHEDRLIAFNDGKNVLIPRPEILKDILKEEMKQT